MKRKYSNTATTIYFLILIFSVMCFTFSCTNNIDGMVTDYNAKLADNSQTSVAVVGSGTSQWHVQDLTDEDFRADDMLADVYAVFDNATLCLAGPTDKEHQAFYTWRFYSVHTSYDPVALSYGYKIKSVKLEEMFVSGYIPVYDRQLIIDIPKVADIIKPGTYKLELKVSKKGEVFEDSCTLAICESF